MTRGEIIFEVSLSLGLDRDTGSDELILMQRWINLGIVDILKKTHCYVDEGDMTLGANVSEYRIDTSILVVDTVHIAGQSAPMIEKPMAWIDRYLLQNPAASAPVYYAIKGTFMRVAPAPSDAAVMRYFYTPKPLEMQADGTLTADNNDPSNATYGGIPDEYHDVIVDFVKWKAAEYDDKGGGFYRGQASAPGSAYYDTYTRSVKLMRREMRRKASRGMHAAVIGYPDDLGVSSSNSAYPER